MQLPGKADWERQHEILARQGMEEIAIFVCG